MDLEKEVKDFLREVCKASDEQTDKYFSATVYMSEAIAVYAHRGQLREDEQPYYVHPFHCRNEYQALVGISDGDPSCVEVELMTQHEIPFQGVQEVCILHDVLEDTDIKIEEIREVFDKYGYGDYFDIYIAQPLKLITHEKNVEYDEYLQRLCENPVSAIVKLMDLSDNSDILQLKELGNYEVERAVRYIKYAKVIEDKYHFLRKALEYKKEYKMKNKPDNTGC